jgi:hypothetical protein
MTNEEILKLANQHLRYFEDGWRGTEWSGTPEDLLKFAQEIRKQTIGEISKSIKFSMEMKGDECIIL